MHSCRAGSKASLDPLDRTYKFICYGVLVAWRLLWLACGTYANSRRQGQLPILRPRGMSYLYLIPSVQVSNQQHRKPSGYSWKTFVFKPDWGRRSNLWRQGSIYEYPVPILLPATENQMWPKKFSNFSTKRAWRNIGYSLTNKLSELSVDFELSTDKRIVKIILRSSKINVDDSA